MKMMLSYAKLVCFAFAGIHARSLAERPFLSQKASACVLSLRALRSSQAPEDFQEAQGCAEVLSFVLQADRERVPVSRCGRACLRVWWVDGWVWVLVDAGCKRVLNNLFEMELRDLNQIYKT